MHAKAKISQGITYIRVQVKHPMQSGLELDSQSGEIIPAKYVQQLSCEYEGKVVLIAQLGPSIPEDPFLEFSFKGAKKGGQVTLRWNDNTGDSLSIEQIIQ